MPLELNLKKTKPIKNQTIDFVLAENRENRTDYHI